ncbi:anthrone oxygenase family protein [Actinoplanes sp. CA-252034]|uniref:anthrone oxygenase family protein n=1 Tax=Actinoplanes sp. CA-252034 TaxID=3239906 RepID=UPI003D986DD1
MRRARLAGGVALLCAGLLAGAFGYARVCVVPTFNAVPIDVHLTYRIALMDMNGIFMQAVMGLTIVSSAVWAVVLRGRARWGAAGAGLLALTALLVTRFGNVPINGEIRTWAATGLPADYADRLARWEAWHDVRTVAALAAFVVLLVVTQGLTTGARQRAAIG